MIDKVYIVVGSSGSWEDAREWRDKAFLDKNRAEFYKNELNRKLKELKNNNDELIKLCEDCTEDLDACGFCRLEIDYSLNEQHDFKIEEVELVK